VRGHLGPRGLFPVQAWGRSRFARCPLGFMKVVKGLMTLRLLRQHAQDLGEVSASGVVYGSEVWETGVGKGVRLGVFDVA
jgi:hypothetical protein